MSRYLVNTNLLGFFVIAPLLALTLICAYTLYIKITVEVRHKILQKINKVSSHLIRYDSNRYKKLFKLVMKCQYYLKPGHVFSGAELKQFNDIKRAEKSELSSKQWAVCTYVCHMLINNTIFLIRHQIESNKQGFLCMKNRSILS